MELGRGEKAREKTVQFTRPSQNSLVSHIDVERERVCETYMESSDKSMIYHPIRRCRAIHSDSSPETRRGCIVSPCSCED